MFDAFTQFIGLSFDFILSQLLVVVAYPLDPRQRIYWAYIVCAILLAGYVFFRRARADGGFPPSFRGFLRFLFPAEIWRSPSAWLDVRYFFFHQIFRLVIYGSFLSATFVFVFEVVRGGVNGGSAPVLTMESGVADIAISTLYMFVLIGLSDFVSYAIHYLQHKIPVLWAFHKVHHSLEVMHPLSNYREHPVDNCAYALGTGAVTGLVLGIATTQLGYIPNMPMVVGVPVLLLAFNVLGYNLRHSHIWLRWPGRWSMVFASPAHHHIHHSCHPDQIDRNFAFLFPVWDVLFRTYYLPDTNKDVRFGLAESDPQEFKSCLGLYFIPFRNILADVFNRFGK
jgi:sterol desaturase/sphingolipid hydroxylase (fatty acid hydroxylase superfamily)